MLLQTDRGPTLEQQFSGPNYLESGNALKQQAITRHRQRTVPSFRASSARMSRRHPLFVEPALAGQLPSGQLLQYERFKARLKTVLQTGGPRRRLNFPVF